MRALSMLTMWTSAACGGAASSGPSTGPEVGWGVGQQVPDVALYDDEGAVSFSDHRGEVLLISLSAMWCAPCADLVEGTEALQERLPDEPFVHLTVLLEGASGLSVDPEECQIWAESVGASGPVWADPDRLTEPGLGAAYPTVRIVGREGEVVAVVDNLDPDELTHLVEAELFQ